MPRNRGRIVIVSDLRPKELLALAEEIALDSQCGVEDLRGEKLRGFHIFDANGSAPVMGVFTFIAASTGNLRVPLDIEVAADTTKRGDGRIALDWIETGNSLRSAVCGTFAQSLADELERRIEDDGGEVFESYDD